MKTKWKIILIISLLGNLSIFYVAMKARGYRAHINEYLDKYTHVVNEFSRRDRYSDENKQLISDTLVNNRIVFIGTQVTENWDLEKYFPKHEVVNRGVSRQRISGYLLRFRPDVIELRPKAVVIEVSSYNFRPQNTVREIEDYVASMAELARTHGIEPLSATIIPPCRKIRGLSDLENYSIMDSISVYNNWLKEYSNQNSYKYIDFNRALSDVDGYMKDEYTYSCIDLNEKGYRRIAEATHSTLKKR